MYRRQCSKAASGSKSRQPPSNTSPPLDRILSCREVAGKLQGSCRHVASLLQACLKLSFLLCLTVPGRRTSALQPPSGEASLKDPATDIDRLRPGKVTGF